MENKKITLRELKAMLPSTHGKDLPSPKALRETGEPLVQADLPDCTMKVYPNGFALYRTSHHYAVLRMEHVGTAVYESTQDDWRSSVDLDGVDWTIGVMLCGEDRMAKKYAERAAERFVSVAGGSEDEDGSDMEFDAGVDVLEEVVLRDDRRRMMDCLTKRQRTAVEMYFFAEMTQEEIAAELGVSRRYVRDLLSNSTKKIKKFFG